MGRAAWEGLVPGQAPAGEEAQQQRKLLELSAGHLLVELPRLIPAGLPEPWQLEGTGILLEAELAQEQGCNKMQGTPEECQVHGPLPRRSHQGPPTHRALRTAPS